MIKTIVTVVTSSIPDTVKITIASVVIAVLGTMYVKAFMIDEIKAHVNPIQSHNEYRFETLLRHNDNQFNLLRDDIRAVREQNQAILNKL